MAAKAKKKGGGFVKHAATFKSVHNRHHDIGNNQVGYLFAGNFYSFFTVFCHDNVIGPTE